MKSNYPDPPGWDQNLLTPRERQIAKHAGRGRAPRKIAIRLGISRQTVYNHLNALGFKLGIETGSARLVGEKARSMGCCPLTTRRKKA